MSLDAPQISRVRLCDFGRPHNKNRSGVEITRSLKNWVKTPEQSGTEIELSGEAKCAVIGLEELVRGRQQELGDKQARPGPAKGLREGRCDKPS
jgi:hypothetical protein